MSASVQSIEVLQVKDVYLDLTETVSGICTEQEEEITVTGEITVEARVPENNHPRIGFRLKGKYQNVGVDSKC